MQDEELIELCKTIYRKHRDAIELIVEYGSSTNFEEPCSKVIQELTDCEYVSASKKMVWFQPVELAKALQEVELNGWGQLALQHPVCCWFAPIRRQGKVKTVLEVGPVADGDCRRKLLQTFEKAGFKIKKMSYNEGAKYTRIASFSAALEKTEDGEPDWSEESIRKVITVLWNKLSKPVEKACNAVQGFPWP